MTIFLFFLFLVLRIVPKNSSCSINIMEGRQGVREGERTERREERAEMEERRLERKKGKID